MEQQDFLNEMEAKKLPSALNTLTILTFIGSGFVILFSLITPWLMKFMKTFSDKALEGQNGATLTPKQIEDIQKGKEVMELASKYMTVTISVGIICAIACIVGAVMMRKQKKDGYTIYVVAEILPVIVGFVLMGTKVYTGVMSVVLGLGIPLLFIILYTVQRKHLTK